MAKVFSVINYCRDCRFGIFAVDFMYRCKLDGSLNHSPVCSSFKQK